MNFNLTDQIAGVRIFHAATFAKPVNIYLNDKLVVDGLKYGEVTNYLPVQKGRNNVKIKETATGKMLYNQTLTLEGNKFITISAIQDTGNVDLIVLEDIIDTRFNPTMINPYFGMPQTFYHQPMMDPMCQMPTQQFPYGFEQPQQQMQPMMWQTYPIKDEDDSYGCQTCNERVDEIDEIESLFPPIPILGNSARVRFVHLSPNAPAVDINLANGTRLFTNTKYKQSTGYIPVGAGNIGLNVLVHGTNQVALSVPSLTLLPNESYTIYAIGLVNGNPPLEAIALRDGI